MVGRLLSAFVLACCAGTAGAQARKGMEHTDWVPLAGQSVPFPAIGMVPQGSAGCLVVGYHILADGTTAKPRVMQGGYTKGTSDEVQAMFAEAVLSAASGWRFGYQGRFIRPIPEFRWTVVGYSPAGTGSGIATNLGLKAQDARVRTACQLDDLATWGTTHALPANASPGQDKVSGPIRRACRGILDCDR